MENQAVFEHDGGDHEVKDFLECFYFDALRKTDPSSRSIIGYRQ